MVSINLTAPGGPPSDIRAVAENSESIRVEWQPPPLEQQNGDITYYKLMIVNHSRPNADADVITISDPTQREYLIPNLRKWTEYRVWMQAGTVVGDGVMSEPELVRTDEDGTYVWTYLSYLFFPFFFIIIISFFYLSHVRVIDIQPNG